MSKNTAQPVLRRDPITSEWVILSAGRGKRPHAPAGPEYTDAEQQKHDCPFCEGRETETPPEITAYRDSGGPGEAGWTVRVFPNKFPILANLEPGEAAAAEDLFDQKPAYGFHEVIADSPNHGLAPWEMGTSQVKAMLDMYRDRIIAHRDSGKIKYVLIIRNHKAAGAASLEHPHSQLFGLTCIPPVIDNELTGFARTSTEEARCVLCDLIKEEEQLGVRVVAANESFIAICPFASRHPYETWIVPRNHANRFEDCEELDDMAKLMTGVLSQFREKLSDPPLNYWIHTYPLHGESRPYHWHLEIMPRLTIAGGLELGGGLWVNVVAPEEAAPFLAGR